MNIVYLVALVLPPKIYLSRNRSPRREPCLRAYCAVSSGADCTVNLRLRRIWRGWLKLEARLMDEYDIRLSFARPDATCQNIKATTLFTGNPEFDSALRGTVVAQLLASRIEAYEEA